MRQVIPLNRATVAGRELEYVQAAAAAGHLAGDGPFAARCEELLETVLGPKVFLTTSCTHALELAMLLLDLQPGDEVILPAFTFVSAVNALVLRGARPVFVDSRPDTLNGDEQQLAALITPRTKAIMVMHYAGVGCAMETIVPLAARAGIPVIEDNAHGLFGTYRGQPLGTFGLFAAHSFHETKNISCGEGGALRVSSPEHVERAEIIRQKGTDRMRVVRGEATEYTWVDVGSSYSLADLLAAFLLGQLEARDRIQARRHALWRRYAEELAPWAKENGIRLPIVPPGCEHPAHIFYLLAPSAEVRRRLILHLKERSISAVFHYLPLHTSTMGQRFGGQRGQFPVAETASECLLRLPLFSGLADDDQSRVLETLSTFKA